MDGDDITFNRLDREVIRSGLCTHCGTCVGLSEGTLAMVDDGGGPLPRKADSREPLVPGLAWEACPGKGIDVPQMYLMHYGSLPENWLIGHCRRLGIGYSAVPEVRRHGASGGVITQTLLYLLEQRRIDGAVVVQQGTPRPWLASPIIATTPDAILAASQSVYVPIPVNTILPEMTDFDGDLAYVGLPDQVASLRRLQQGGHPGARKVKYVLGPYVGTAMYLDAIRSYLRANGVNNLEEVVRLSYRAGEWPGYLEVECSSGRVLRAHKFYYNYLIPFYITRASLLSTDFANEFTDISVGDAWHPQLEGQGGGYSVVVARSAAGEALIGEMQAAGILEFDDVSLDTALSMHGHMLDFKKRGAFIRTRWRRALGKEVPQVGYAPQRIPISRMAVELVISAIFAVCRTWIARAMANRIPITILGPAFNTLRKRWKSISRPTKRKGLRDLQFSVETSSTPGP